MSLCPNERNPYEAWGIDAELYNRMRAVEQALHPVHAHLEAIREINQLRVLQAMQAAGVSEAGFAGTTGYGYDDRGRDQLEAVYAQVFETEAALVRSQISAGTQALTIALFALLRPGDELLSITGAPYDTLKSVIGLSASSDQGGSLADFGIQYRQIEWNEQKDEPDWAAIEQAVRPQTRVVLIQRSRGYGQRRALRVDEIGDLIRCVKRQQPSVVVLVDNCYGEFTETREPTAVGADLCVGSLIKNPGGGLAPTGAYLVGRQAYVDRCAKRLYAPGLDNHVGPTLGLNRLLMQGFYFAPHVVVECLKGLTFAAAWFEHFGYESAPGPRDLRSDIIQTLTFREQKPMLEFCRSVQKASPVDAYVTPEPWAMPGYDSEVIMAAGAFIQGSSMELSADGPVKPPYTVYLQGGLVYENVKLAALLATQQIQQSQRGGEGT